MNSKKRTVVGLFAEGSRLTDPNRNWFEKMWRLLAEHCNHPIELKVFGLEKSQIVRLRPEKLPIRSKATQLIKKKGATQLVGGAEAIDAYIARTTASENLDRVIIAFDAWKPNQQLNEAERNRPCIMRSEITFLLEYFKESQVLPEKIKAAATRLLSRYRSDEPLTPRDGRLEALEILFMNPMFEALFQYDERTVLKALGFQSIPKDWPKFKTRERALDKFVLDPAVECKTRYDGQYLAAKSKWGYEIVRAAGESSLLWRHQITTRLCRILATSTNS